MRQILRDITHSIDCMGVTSGVATAVPFANATQVTICGWVKLRIGDGFVYETSGLYSAANAFVLSSGVFAAQNTLYAAHADATHGGLICSGYTAPLPIGVWLRFVHVIDQSVSSSQGKLYINGAPSPLTYTSNQNCTAGIATNNMYFAARNSVTLPLSGGLVVDRITTGKAYTAAEALSEYQTARYPTGGTILASYDWTPNNSMTVVTDSGTGAKNITLTAPVWSLDTPVSARHQKVQIPYSVQINAIGDKITVGNAASLQTANGTVAFWTKIPKTLTASATFWGLVAKDNAWLICTLNSIATPVLGFYDYATTTHRTSNYYINDDRWHWVAFVYQSGVANGSAVYVDGCMVVSGLMTKNNDATQMAIGGYASASAAIVGAYYADASFHNVALTPAQIRAWYLTGRKPTTGLVSTWPITEGTGTVIADTTGTNTGTLT